jgi:RNA polymerase sigma-70 factor (ECF subfamily)
VALISEHVSKSNLKAVSQNGQADAEFEAVFLEHYSRVYAVLYRLVGDRAEAEDLAVETFWKLWQRPPARPDNLMGWLYRVATNLGYNALRAARRRYKYEEVAGRDAIDLTTFPDPALEADRAADRRRARMVLQKLSARDAQILILRHSGFAYKEIAEAVGVSPTSVGTLLARAEAEFERFYDDTSD